MPATKGSMQGLLHEGGRVVIVLGLFAACSAREKDGSAELTSPIRSVVTSLAASDCRREVDAADPNETAYWVCPGVAGYTLVVRRVDAGRRSIDVVDPGQRATPLNYQEVVTRHMSSLAPQAEWRVRTDDGRDVPIALIVRVQAREDEDDPERVTRSFLAVAKITAAESCVTDRIEEGPQAEVEARAAADAASGRTCASPQPPMTMDGAVVR